MIIIITISGWRIKTDSEEETSFRSFHAYFLLSDQKYIIKNTEVYSDILIADTKSIYQL